MSEPILVTGGTGALGRQVVRRLAERGRPVRALSRHARTEDLPEGCTAFAVDLRTGAGLADALREVGVVVHCASSRSVKDLSVTRNLLDTARSAGGPHVVYISIVGVDRVPFPYYKAKLAEERLIGSSGLPWTILRATQFHDLLRVVFAAAAKLPVMPVPAMPFQPVDTGEVAGRLVELALGEPVMRADDLGGPRVRPATDLARAFLEASGLRRPLLPVRLPGRVFRAYRQGGHLCPDHADGTITFEQYLAAQPKPAAVSYPGRPK